MNKMTHKIVLCLFSSLCLEQGALLAETWNGGTGNWNVAGNWTPASVPNAIDAVATFDNVSTPNLAGVSITVGTINNNTGAALGGGIFSNIGTPTFTLQTSSGNPTLNAVSGSFDISMNTVTFSLPGSTVDVVPTAGNFSLSTADFNGNTYTFNIGRGSAPFDMLINGVSNGTFVKNGAGILSIQSNSGHNLTVNQGSVICVGSSLNSSTDCTLGAGTSIDFNGNSQSTNTLNGSGSISGSGNLTVGAGGGSSTFSGVISNTGSLIKNSTGTFVTAGASSNAYTGTTTLLSSGTLVLAKSGGAVAIPGAITLGGTSTVRTDAANQFASTSNVTMNAAVTFNLNNNSQMIATLTGNNAGATIPTGTGAGGILTTNTASSSTFLGAITQNGGLAKQGTGILTLTGTNTFTGGTTVSGGTLRAGAANAFPANTNYTASGSGVLDLNNNSLTASSLSGSGSVTLGANPATTLTTGTTSSTFSGVVSGSGQLIKAGAGTFVLTGINTYSGGTTVSAGVLQGTTDGLQGAIANNASLVFDQLTTGTYAGAITGTGSFTKQNTGTVFLTGVNAIGSTTTIAGGALHVNNTFTSTGALTVQSGGTLAGTGTVTAPTFMVNGTLSPGNSIGTIFLVGAITQATGSTLEIEITPSAADLVDITGTYAIEPNATLSILVDPGIYPPEYMQTIVTTTGGRSGEFTNVTASLPTFSPLVTYTDNDILLMIMTQLPFAGVVPSGDAGAAASCFDTVPTPAGSDAELVNAELRMIPTVEELADNLDLMQPSQLTALALAQENATLYINETLFHRLDQQTKECAKNPSYPNKRSAFWAAPLFGFTDQRNLNGEPGFRNNTEGVALGLDHHLKEWLVLGGSLGYSHLDLTWKKKRGHSSMNNGYGTLYFGMFATHGYLYGSVVGGYNRYEESRKIKFSCDCLTTINRKARSHHNGWQTSGHLKGGGLFTAGSAVISPFAAVDYLYQHENGFTEKGAGSLNLTVQEKTSDVLVGEAGLEVSRCFSLLRNEVAPWFALSAVREQRFRGKHYNSSFVGSSCVMHTKGINPSRTLFSPTVGLTFLIPDSSCTLSFEYKGKFGKRYTDQNILAEFLYRF